MLTNRSGALILRCSDFGGDNRQTDRQTNYFTPAHARGGKKKKKTHIAASAVTDTQIYIHTQKPITIMFIHAITAKA